MWGIECNLSNSNKKKVQTAGKLFQAGFNKELS